MVTWMDIKQIFFKVIVAVKFNIKMYYVNLDLSFATLTVIHVSFVFVSTSVYVCGVYLHTFCKTTTAFPTTSTVDFKVEQRPITSGLLVFT